MTEKTFEYIGWLGFVFIVGAYLLLTIQALAADSGSYHAINLAGALCMVVNAKHKGSKPLFWLNLVWAFIASAGLYQAADF